MYEACMKLLSALLLALSLLATGMALGEEELELGEATTGLEEMDALPQLALGGDALAVDSAALVTEDVAANAEGDEIVAKINRANFPAKDFRNYVLANIDANGDKKLSRAEADGVTELVLRTWDDRWEGRNAYNLSTLKGVEYFENLEELICQGCKIRTLDVSKNAKLRLLDCVKNELTALDISKNARLVKLDCSDNGIGALDTGANTDQEHLNAMDNRLTALDVSRNAELQFLYTSGNAIKILDLKHNRTLRDYLKNKIWKEEDGVFWSWDGDSEIWGLGIDYSTLLTSGSKVLYMGR